MPIETVDGDHTTVEITPLDDHDATLDALLATTVEQHGDDIVVHVPGRFSVLGRSPKLAIAITAPHDARLAIKTGSADVVATGRFGTSVLSSGSGDLTLGDFSDSLRINSGSGDVRVESVAKDVVAKTGSGDIDVVDVEGDASITSGSGDIVVGGGRRGVVAKTGSGNITVGSAPPDLAHRHRLRRHPDRRRHRGRDQGQGGVRRHPRRRAAGDRAHGSTCTPSAVGWPAASTLRGSRRATIARCACTCRRSAATSIWPGSDPGSAPARRVVPFAPARRLSWRAMGKLCERPGCSDVAAMAYGFDVDRLLVWLASPRPGRRSRPVPARSASATPTRWSCLAGLDARRPPREAEPAPASAPSRTRRPRRPRRAGVPAARRRPSRRPRWSRRRSRRSPRRRLPEAVTPVVELDEARTVAEVTGEPSATDDPDATQAIPWMPAFDEQDDLGGVLAADSPLLARAFRGTDRPPDVRTTITARIDGADQRQVFEQVASLENYPAWLRMVHRVEPDGTEAGRPAWHVELRARVGPLTRSKRLRMVRTVFEPQRHVKFERVQDDDRDHAEWILEATVDDGAAGAGRHDGSQVHGNLWAERAGAHPRRRVGARPERTA